MILYIASIVLFIFISFNLLFRTSCSITFKVIICGILLVISLKYEIYQFFGGAFFAPQLPRTLIIVLEALYGAFICLFFLLLLWDLYLAGNWLLAKIGFPVPHKLPSGWIRAGLCVFALFLGIWGTYSAIKVPDIRRMNVEIRNLPEALNGVSLVQLTDIHIGPILKKDWLKKVVERVNSLSPDLILMTGDYIDGYVAQIGQELEPLADLRARYGVLAVTGNHEYYWNMGEWKETLEKLNLQFLENSHRAFHINGETLIVAGIPDIAAARFGQTVPDLGKALENCPPGVKILLSHQPREASTYLEKVDLMLSGHTHGGLMFFLQPLVARFNAGFVNGIYPRHGSNLYVSPGTALWNGMSCRIGVPAEITYITLAQAK